MAKVDVLARVKQDLALGHTHSATQRLRTLVTVHPEDIELREMLASVYRQTGNLAEAGRWAFVTSELPTDEQAAFERANPDPWLRLRMLRWSGQRSDLTDGARARVDKLVTDARRAGPPSTYQGPLSPYQRRRRLLRGSTVPCLFVVAVLVSLGSLAAIGFIRAINWLLG